MSSITRTKATNTTIVIKKATEQMMLEKAIKAVAQAKALAPVDYGQLRNSLSVATIDSNYMLNDSEGEKADAINTEGLKEGEYYIGSNSDHTIFQEYGTIYQPAQPFLRPAVELEIKHKSALATQVKYSRKLMKAELKYRKIKRALSG